MANTNEIQNVILIGGNGNLGSMVLKGLIDAGFNVSVLTRPSSTGTFPASVKVVRAEYTQAELVRAFRGQDAVVSVIGATGFQEQVLLIDAAIEAGVKRFMPSEMGANTFSDAGRGLAPVFEPKKTVLDYLKAKEAQISWTGLATGFILDFTFQIGFLDFDPAQKTAKIWDDGNKVFSCVTAAQLGEAVAGVLKAPLQTANQYLYVSTCAISQNEILEIAEKLTGSPWSVTHVKSEDEIASARKLAGEGDVSGIFTLVKATGLSNIPGLRANFAVDEKLSNQIVGLPEASDKEEVLKSVLVK